MAEEGRKRPKKKDEKKPSKPSIRNNNNNKKKVDNDKIENKKEKEKEKKDVSSSGENSSNSNVSKTKSRSKKTENKGKNNGEKKEDSKKSRPKKKNVNKKSKNDLKPAQRDSKPSRRETQRLQAALEQNYKKLVVRMLPPMLTENQFWDTIDTTIFNDKQKYFDDNGIVEQYFHQGGSLSRFASISTRKKSFSRMYIIFKDLECARKFSIQVKDLMFTDSEDNSNKPALKISQYVKLFINTSKRSRIDNSSLEGTIEDDDIFKNFIKSMDYVKAHQFEEDMEGISMLRPIEAELKLKRKRTEAAAKAAEIALTKLSGTKVRSKKKRDKKKNGDDSSKKKSKKKRRRRKRKSKEERLAEKMKNGSNTEIKNMVILEKAGQKILKERLKNEKKKGSNTSLPALKGNSSDSSGNNTSNKKVPILLKRSS